MVLGHGSQAPGRQRRRAGVTGPQWLSGLTLMTMTALWRSSCGGCGFGALRQGLDRHAGGDRAAGEDVCSEATAVDESPEGAGLGETLKVSAGLAEALTETLDVADEEVAPDKTVEVDTAGDDVAAGVGVGEASRPGARVHRAPRPR